MIVSLHIRNLATIEDLEINFDPGFNILTGETGAGKSIIIDAIKLLLGERASPEIIRTGKKEASVEAVFQVKDLVTASPLFPYLENGEIFLQRSISVEGTGRAHINGILVPVRRLKDIAEELVDIYGQNDHIFLLHLENQLNYLDAYCEAGPLRQELASLSRRLRDLLEEKKTIEERRRERERRLDFLSYQIEELRRANLRPGELEDLLTERHLLKNAEKITFLSEKALEIAYAGENALLTLLSRFTSYLAELGKFNPSFEELNQNLEPLAILLREAVDSLLRFRESQEAAPERLEKVEERLSQIEKLRRKYGGDVKDLIDYLGKIEQEREKLLGSEERLSDLNQEIQVTFASYENKARLLSQLRQEAARQLERELEKEITQLGMKQARFKVKVTPHPFSQAESQAIKEMGWDEIEFLISPNPGEELRPLRRIASGGELSRIMLALKAIGKEATAGKTLIFDEIDAGIGGKTADFIAQKLRSLARRHQVLCITHLPQIASSASHHWLVDKRIERERTFTLVKKLGFEERVKEISRLLSGRRVTAISLQNAREMLRHNLSNQAESEEKEKIKSNS